MDSMIVLELPFNPSTGYQWELINYSRVKGFVEEVKGAPQGPKHPEVVFDKGSMPGAPQVQLVRLVGVAEGMGKVELAYRRPWEAGHTKVHQLTVHSHGKFRGHFQVQRPDETSATQDNYYHVSSLPSHFDWREQGGVTPVRDQGSCGSCWAFGAVAAFEAKIKIKDGVEKDLAEQYLVSCNDDGFSCAGGWWAHDYHYFKCIPSESGAGARYESEFAYQATDVPCNAPHTPYEQLEGWAYTDDVADGQTPTVDHYPTVAQIKEKIYNYGPVGTDVCSNTWGSYSGGVHTNDCTTPTHIVLITGWDDTEGCFYIKNSWGTGWGESGYMRLAYGTCLVGHNSTYLLYEKTNPRILFRSTIFHEHKNNDGSVGNSLELRIEDSTSATQFAVTSGSMQEGTHYTVANLPAGMSLSVTALSSTEATLAISGSSSNHLDANDVSNLTVSFLNAAFTGNDATAVENSVFSELRINFFDPYQLIYYNVDDVTISPSNTWQYYWLEGSDYTYGFGLWWYDSANEPDPNNNQCLKFETYTKPALSHGIAIPPDLKALNYGEEIGPNSTQWAAGGSYGGQHTLAGPAYSDWKGQTKYMGFSFNYNGYPVYGWFKIQVSADGTQGTILEYAWQQDPNKSIRAGYVDDSPGQPSADFTANPTTVDMGNTVQFTDNSVGSPTSWSWTFTGGTPSSSTAQNPVVTYSTPGTYDVTLTATNAYGSDTKTISSYITVVDPNAITYCASQGNDNSSEWIAGVQVGDLNNTSGASGYSDFTSMTANLATNQSVSVTLTPGFPSGSYTEYWVMWIDYNCDGDFNDSGEEVFSGSGNSAVTGSFTVPSSATVGTTRMRVSMRYNNAPTSCGSFDYGEVEDYTVDISSGGASSVTAGFTYNANYLAVAFADTSTASGTTITSWSWDFGDGNTSTDQNPSHTYAGDGTYSVSLTVSDGGSNSDTETTSVTVTSGSGIQYCSATHIYDYGYITNVTVGSINNDSGWGSSGYADFTSQATTMEIGTGYPITVTCDDQHWPLNAMGIWVDWNRDGDFDDSGESIYTYQGAGPYSTTITPPSSAVIGSTRMRVRMMYDTTAVPCGADNYFGDVEDYTINVTSSSGPSVSADFSYSTNFLAVNFTDASTASGTTISSWSWDFGDGNTSTQQNPSHTYAGEGSYNVTLTVSDGGSNSDNITKSVSVAAAPPATYCTATHLNDYGYISNVLVGTIDNTSVWGTNGYADFTGQSTTMAKSTGYSITVTCQNQHWPENMLGIWVDWNQDGDFDDSGEFVYSYTGAGPYSTTITPPSGATTGSTRMRIRMMYYTHSLIPCGDDGYYGDVEDYTIIVTD